MIVINEADSMYLEALTEEWLGGKKNDAVIFIGVDTVSRRIVWADAMTWALGTGNELLNVKMRDGLEAIGTLDPERIVPFVSTTIAAHYTRPHMEDFEYLADAVEPPLWVMIIAVIIAIGGSIALTVVFHHIEVDFFGGRGSSRRRKW